MPKQKPLTFEEAVNYLSQMVEKVINKMKNDNVCQIYY